MPGSGKSKSTKRLSRRALQKARRELTGYRSGYEQTIAENLLKAEIAFEYEPECLAYPLPLRGSRCIKCGSPATRTAHYTPDFRFENGCRVEAKGKFTATNRTRLLAVKQAHADKRICLLFQRDNWLTKTHTQKYTDWAKKHGFECAVGTEVPQAWTWTKK